MYTHTTLTNGLPLVVQEAKGVDSVTVLILVGAGSRYEQRHQSGLSHFLEHMFFKGAKKYKTPKEVSLAIDGKGGVFNAFTDKEYAGYYIKIAKEHLETAFEVLSDMLLYPTFPEQEIEKERGVIIEELNMYQDSPRQQIFWDFEKHYIGDQPLGWDEGGDTEVIKTAQKKDFDAYKEQLYTPDNTVISVSGNVSGDEVHKMTEKYFGALKGNKDFHFQAVDMQLVAQEKVFIRQKKTDQAHLIIGHRGVDAQSEQRWIQRLFTTIIGGNSSSRMFQNIREEKGLCYYVYTSNSQYQDIGMSFTRAGVSVDKVEEAIALIMEEYKKVSTHYPITEEELRHAKEYYKGTVTLSLEDTEEQAHFLGKQLLLKGHIEELARVKEHIEAVQLADIQSFIEEYIQPWDFYLSIIGPYKGKEDAFLKLIT